jgi:hypothetical protein
MSDTASQDRLTAEDEAYKRIRERHPDFPVGWKFSDAAELLVSTRKDMDDAMRKGQARH